MSQFSHVTQFFETEAPFDQMAAEADRLLNALLELEEADPRVTDATISLDGTAHRLTVEVGVPDADRETSEFLAVDRVAAAFELAGLPVITESVNEREIELVTS